MAEYVVAQTGEIQPSQCKIVTINKTQIGLYLIDGNYYALPNICPHQLGPLCEGAVAGAIQADGESNWKGTWRLDGQVVTCPWHGLEFHIPTGQCLALAKVKLRQYAVTVDGTDIKITL
jgi:nitrite reductase (NADH) small subunit